jgi:hypothetical protein
MKTRLLRLIAAEERRQKRAEKREERRRRRKVMGGSHDTQRDRLSASPPTGAGGRELSSR